MCNKKPLIGSLIVLCVLVLTVAGCSKAKELAPELVMKKAYAATTEEVTSFHFNVSFTLTVEGMGETTVMGLEGDYLAPDRMRVKQAYGEELFEAIIVGSQAYQRDSGSSLWEVREYGSAMTMGLRSLVDTEKSLGFMESPGENVTQLDNETIDSVECWRYRITIDLLEELIQAVEEATGPEVEGADPEIKEMRQEMVNLWRETETTQTVEVWVGKEDYLVRQYRSVTSQKAMEDMDDIFDSIDISEGTRYTITSTSRLSDFNEPVEIETPEGPFR